MGTLYRVSDRAELLKVICTATPDLKAGPEEIITIQLWSKRIMVADFHLGEDEDFDIIVIRGKPNKPEKLNLYFLEMVEERTAFTMKLEARGVIYPVRWRIKQ